MEIISYLDEKKKIIDQYLDESLPTEKQDPATIHRSIRYSVLNGGKRFRPILTLMTAELLNQPNQKVLPTAAGIELIHTFSLIHDDLPSMDNDDYRRGKLTNHKVFGEALAILTGDALLVMGLDFICRNSQIEGIRKTSVMKVLEIVLDKLGTKNMLGGQVDDISWHFKREESDYIQTIYLKKTSALICAAIQAGALLGNANKKQLKALENYGKYIGLAFQITDDLLDLQQDKGMPEKPTYPGIFGIEESRKEALEYSKKAKESLATFAGKAELFYQLADFIIQRQQ